MDVNFSDFEEKWFRSPEYMQTYWQWLAERGFHAHLHTLMDEADARQFIFQAEKQRVERTLQGNSGVRRVNPKERFILNFLSVSPNGLAHAVRVGKALKKTFPGTTQADAGEALFKLKTWGFVSALGDGTWSILFDGAVEIARVASQGVI